MKTLRYLLVSIAILCFPVASRAEWFSWEARTNLTGAQLDALAAEMVKRGFTPKRLSSSVVGDDFRYATIWVKLPEPTGWQLRIGMPEREFLAEVEALKTKGFRPFDISVNTYKGVPVFNGIWHQDPSASWQWRIHLTQPDAIKNTREFSARGLIPTDIDAYEAGGAPVYSVLWSESAFTDFRLAFAAGEAEYTEATRVMPKGFLPYDFNVLSLAGQLFFSAVWVRDDSMSWANFQGYNDQNFQPFFDTMVGDGFGLHGVSTYVEGNTLKYGGIFAKEKPESSSESPTYRSIERSAARAGKTLPITPVYQQTKVWCWLAIGEMIFRHYDVRNLNPVGNYQCGIIGTIFPATPCNANCFNDVCIIPSGSNYNTVRMLKDYAWMASRKVFNASEGNELPFAVIKDNIDRGRPIIAGVSPTKRQYHSGAEHVALIVGYEVDRGEVLVVVNDPFPYPPNANPYFAAGGRQTAPYRYTLHLKNFTEGIFWHWSIYNISLS